MTLHLNHQAQLSGNKMAVILEGCFRVPYEELETIKNKLNEHIENIIVTEKIANLYIELKKINKKLWNIEDEIRKKE